MADVRDSKLGMLQALPGLYMSRDWILEQIETIEIALGIVEAPRRPRGRPRKEDVVAVAVTLPVAQPEQQEHRNGNRHAFQTPGTPEYEAWRKKIKAQRKKIWRVMTEEQKQERLAAMKAGRNRALREKKKAA